MRALPLHLINGTHLDLMPASLAKARAIQTQRLLANSQWLLRRKEDGRFLACARRIRRGPDWTWLDAAAAGGALRAEAARLLRRARRSQSRHADRDFLPASAADPLFASGLRDYASRTGLLPVQEPATLEFAGFDRYRRPLWLRANAAAAWRCIQARAFRDAVVLEAISGFRSRAYQRGIFRRKIGRGQSVEQILAVNAAPGYSEHHGGHALDVGTPGEAPAEVGFESTAAFEWLRAHAAHFGFRMSYPRGNPHGIDYEPWHWCWHPRP